MNILSDDDLALLEKAKNAAQSKTTDIPLGYTPIELSTQGKLGAPKTFHIRNFKTSDLVDLSLTSQEDLPETVSRMIDSMIFEKDISIKNFHEKEVVELLVRLFMIFFSPRIDIDFPIINEDLDYLKEKISHEEYMQTISDLQSRKWVPQVNIDLSKIKTHDLDVKFSPIVTITSKRTSEKFKFSFPKFGDLLVVKKFLKLRFEAQDKKFASLRRMVEFRNEMEEKFKNGENVEISKIPNIPESEESALRIYETEKASYAVDLIRAVQIIGYNDKDLSNLPLDEKLKILNATSLDHVINKKLESYYESLKFGLEDTIEMLNPFKKISEPRRYSFRLLDILQAVNSFESDEYDIVVGDPS